MLLKLKLFLQDFQERCNLLESQLKELKEKSLGMGKNHTLPVNGENKEAQTQLAAIESDLASVLKTITEGVESGVIKVGVSKIHTCTCKCLHLCIIHANILFFCTCTMYM